MANLQKMIRDERKDLEDSLNLLSRLTQDLEAASRSPKFKAPPKASKYAGGVSDKEGDEEFRAILGTKASIFGKAFGNRDAQRIYSKLLNDLNLANGTEKSVGVWNKLAAQVAITLLVNVCLEQSKVFDKSSSIKSFWSALSAAMETESSINGVLDLIVSETGTGKIGDRFRNIAGTAATKSRLFELIYPINPGYIRMVDYKAGFDLEELDKMKEYVADTAAQRAAELYVAKKRPASNVLLPIAIEGTGKDAVTSALASYPETSLKATFNYYKSAVANSYDTGLSLRSAEFDARIGHAINGLKRIPSLMSNALVSKSVVAEFKPEINSVISDLSKIKVTSVDARVDIVIATAHLLNIMGVAVGDVSTFAPNMVAGTAPANEAIEDAYSAVSTNLDTLNPLVTEAQALLQPADIQNLSVENVSPDEAALKNTMITILGSLNQAYKEVVPLDLLGRGTVSAVAPQVKELVISDKFKDFVNTEIAKSFTSMYNAAKSIGATAGTGAEAAMQDLLVKVFDLVLGLGGTAGVDKTSNRLLTELNNGNPIDKDTVAKMKISTAFYENVLYGNVSSLSSSQLTGVTLATEIKSAAKRLTSGLSSKVQRATKDFGDRSAERLMINLNSVSISAQAMGIPMQTRANPAYLTKTALTWGAGSLLGDHVVTAALNSQIQPEYGSVTSHVVNYGPSLATAAYGVRSWQQGDVESGAGLIGGALAHLLVRHAAKVPSIRFGDGILSKVVNALGNAPASILGDQSMGASGLTPANAGKHQGKIGSYILELARTNCPESLCYIALQLWHNGLSSSVSDNLHEVMIHSGENAPKLDDLNIIFSVGSAHELSSEDIKKVVSAMNAQRSTQTDMSSSIISSHVSSCSVSDLFEILGVLQGVSCASDIGLSLSASGDKIGVSFPEGTDYAEYQKKYAEKYEEIQEQCGKMLIHFVQNVLGLNDVLSSDMTAQTFHRLVKSVINACNKPTVPKVEEVKGAEAESQAVEEQTAQVPSQNGLHGFILEPGYNMDVYSGEDQVSLLDPAPRVTAQSGIVQLEDAVAAAERLGPHDKLAEGIGDLQDVAVIRAEPVMARQVEGAGLGVSLGQSRTNPGTELVALEVEGDVGLLPIAPERQHSVPQGNLNYAQIGHAPNVDVTPHGLFNRGVFSPIYGRS